jgi:protein-S-isoprenylcysteine O-methyltransferase Ste14
MTADRLVPILLLTIMAGVETYAAARRRADAPDADRGSLRLVQALTFLGYFLAFTAWRRAPAPQLGAWALFVGAALALAGAALRVWSIATLGRWFTVRVHVSGDQPVVQSGPYAVLRHPSYAGALLMAAGIGLSLRDAVGPVLTVAPQLIGLAVRMRVEERALAAALGEPYRAYMLRTKRIIPFVW